MGVKTSVDIVLVITVQKCLETQGPRSRGQGGTCPPRQYF